jgi:biotin carboxyl carrier protein
MPTAVREDAVAHVDVDGQSLEFAPAAAPTIEDAVRHASQASGVGPAALVAPMPGRVIAVRAARGASVRAQQPVIVIEAMKMEHAVVAPADGIVSEVLVAEGQQVQRGDLLAEVTGEGDGHTSPTDD